MFTKNTNGPVIHQAAGHILSGMDALERVQGLFEAALGSNRDELVVSACSMGSLPMQR
jgi:hypothetical protein